jgi:signal transduction histidine kinase
MFWMKDNSFYKTLVFRLTFRYILLFTVFNIVLILVIFLRIKSSQEDINDKNLVVKVKSALHLSNFNNNKQSGYELTSKSVMEGVENSFYLIADSTHNIVATSYIEPWGNLQFVTRYIPKLPSLPLIDPHISKMPDAWNENNVKIQPELLYKDVWSLNYVFFRTFDFNKLNHKARVAFVYLPNNSILIVGVSLSENEEFLNSTKKIFIFFLIVMILFGSLLGYFIAKKSMVDVVRITNATENIKKGNLSLRVKSGSNSLELQNLANAFNSMLDRIEKLIIEQKEMTNNIAHDLRSPITSIRGITETTLSGKQSIQEYQEMCGQVINECDRLINMVNSTLDISEIEAGTFEIPFEEISMQELMIDAYEMYLPVAELKGIRLLLVNPQNKTIVIQGNKPLLQRAIANILDNAIKYTPSEGEVKIDAYTQNKHFIISINDTGIGISLEEQNHIYEKFYRVDKSRSTIGNGLGLSLAFAYVLFHKGTIEVKSEPGKGSTFTISLPYT